MLIPPSMQLSNISNSSVINPTRFLRHWGDCHCRNVSWGLFLSEEMTANLPMQIKLVFTDLPWVFIFIPLWSSNTTWRVPDRSLDKTVSNEPSLCMGRSPNPMPLARIHFLFSFTMILLQTLYLYFFPSSLGEALGTDAQKIPQWIWCWNSDC